LSDSQRTLKSELDRAAAALEANVTQENWERFKAARERVLALSEPIGCPHPDCDDTSQSACGADDCPNGPRAQRTAELRAARLEQALRGLALAASEFLHVTLCDKISDTVAWRKLSGAVTRALECADAK